MANDKGAQRIDRRDSAAFSSWQPSAPPFRDAAAVDSERRLHTRCLVESGMSSICQRHFASAAKATKTR